MKRHERVDYLEFPSSDFDVSKKFFTEVFDWIFTDYRSDYIAFSNAGIEGGFYRSDLIVSTENGSVLVVFYSEQLEETQRKIEQASGTIKEPIFSFPGGRRFHFCDPTGNEYAVWSET